MKNYFLTITINLIVICNIYSQSDIISDSTGLEEIVISASKDAQSKRNVPFQIETIDARQISFQNGQTMSNVLENSGAVVVQRSQQGGGSPMIRGFEASRILLVMDGVRMNNLIYRSGHLQNIMTIDPSILDRAEVLYGPSSTVYGSDALGGTIHMVTKRPKLNLVTEGVKIDLNASIRYGSINQEKTSHVNVNFGTKRFASLTGLTYSDFGNLKMGQNTQALDTLWG
jgi:hemoglobin/transferrin/lactoferrin receptor protein